MVTSADRGQAIAAAIIVPCASRKCAPASEVAGAVMLPRGKQKDVESDWRRRVDELPAVCRADELYAGRGFKLARRAAASANAPLYVASAGLGLVAGDRRVPSYSITVANGMPDSVADRIIDGFDVSRWWGAVSRGPFSTAACDLPEGPLPVVAALSRPYARMISAELGGVRAPERWRLIGTGLKAILPSMLHESVMPYDERLEGILPGTRADFPQRALVHFVDEVLRRDSMGDLAAHAAAVEAALSRAVAPERARRPRRGDSEIREAIRRRLGSETGIARLLRRLRDEDGIACEQARFGRLYRDVLGSETR